MMNNCLAFASKVFPSDYNVGSSSIAESVLYRKWKVVCIISWAVFFTYEIIISLQYYLSEKPLCGFVPTEFGSFYTFACTTTVSGFFFTVILLITRIFEAKPGIERIPSIIALHIVFIGLLFSIMFVAFNWNGICIDIIGVATPGIMWGDWLCNGPVIVFLIIALEGKKELNRMDQTIIVSFFLCLLCGFIRIIPQPQFMGYFWFGLSCVLCVPALLLPWYISHQAPQSTSDIETGLQNSVVVNRQQQKRFYLAVWLIVFTQLIGVTFLLSANKVIGPADTVGVFMLLSLLLQGFFAAVVANAHTHALVEVQQELEKERLANQSRRDFLKYLFHEVRTPLNSLTMGIELLKAKKEGLDQEDRDVLAMMKGSSDFMVETLNDVLSMQKIEEGKLELIFAPFSIGDSISKIFLALSGGLSSKTLRVERDIAAGVPALLIGDAYRVEHVISNLLSNAIKFSPVGGAIRVSVDAAPAPEPEEGGGALRVGPLAYSSSSESGTSITVSVTDEGPGISAENQKRLFEGFFQVRPDQLQQGQGSGLGLALCKQIVTLHGGTIGVDSAEGQGSTFHFTIVFRIPIADSDEFALKEIEGEGVLGVVQATTSVRSFRDLSFSRATTGPAFSDSVISKFTSEVSLNILVVDDVSSNRKMLKMLLTKGAAHSVDTAEDGLQAVTAVLASPEKYHVIFMDNFMPVMTGIEAVQRLRQEGYMKLVVGVTGNVLDDDVVEFLSAGADMVMGKPMKVSSLTALLQHVQQHGPLSRPGMKLSEERGGTLTWKAKESEH